MADGAPRSDLDPDAEQSKLSLTHSGKQVSVCGLYQGVEPHRSLSLFPTTAAKLPLDPLHHHCSLLCPSVPKLVTSLFQLSLFSIFTRALFASFCQIRWKKPFPAHLEQSKNIMKCFASLYVSAVVSPSVYEQHRSYLMYVHTHTHTHER